MHPWAIKGNKLYKMTTNKNEYMFQVIKKIRVDRNKKEVKAEKISNFNKKLYNNICQFTKLLRYILCILNKIWIKLKLDVY